MKKLVWLALMLITGFMATAQDNYSGTVTVGIPVGDIGDWKFSLQVDFEATWEADESIDVGATVGYGHIFGGDVNGIDLTDYQYIPIAATANFELSSGFNLEADAGYAIGISDASNGGFYYRPGLSYDLSEDLNIGAYYTGISDDGFTASTISAGLRFNF